MTDPLSAPRVAVYSGTFDPITLGHEDVIRRAAGLCLKRVDLTRRFRLLGVRASKLVKPGTAEHPAAAQNAPHTKHRDKAHRDEHTDLPFPELE